MCISSVQGAFGELVQVSSDATRGAGEGNIQHAEPVFGAPSSHHSPVQHSAAFSVATSLLSDFFT